MPLAGGASQLGVVLIGHGSPALDCPPRLIGELMSLEWRHDHGSPGGHALTGRAAELDATIRNWPRRADNDPYKRGLERLAEALRPLLPTDHFVIGYNEFCRPSIPDAVGQVIGMGVTRVLVMSTMLTPGGVHSEVDIPRALDELRRAHPMVAIEYVWPFDLHQVAVLLASHVAQAARSPSAAEKYPPGG